MGKINGKKSETYAKKLYPEDIERYKEKLDKLKEELYSTELDLDEVMENTSNLYDEIQERDENIYRLMKAIDMLENKLKDKKQKKNMIK